MEELALQEKPGFFSRLSGLFTRDDGYDDAIPELETPKSGPSLRTAYRYTVTVRRQIQAFDDALAAADGLRRGEQQVLNLTMTEPTVRQKIVDFMSGVNYAQDGTWEEIGDHIFMLVPSNAHVEVESGTTRYTAQRN